MITSRCKEDGCVSPPLGCDAGASPRPTGAPVLREHIRPAYQKQKTQLRARGLRLGGDGALLRRAVTEHDTKNNHAV